MKRALAVAGALLLAGCPLPKPSFPADARVEVALSEPETPTGVARAFLRWPPAVGENIQGYELKLDNRALPLTREPALAFDLEDRAPHRVAIVALNLDNQRSNVLTGAIPASPAPAPPAEGPALEVRRVRVLAGEVPEQSLRDTFTREGAAMVRCLRARPPAAPVERTLRLRLMDAMVQEVRQDPAGTPEAELLKCMGDRLDVLGLAGPQKGRALVAVDLVLRAPAPPAP